MQDHTQDNNHKSITLQAAAILLVAGIAQALSLAWPIEGAFKGEAQGWLQCASLGILAYQLDRSHSSKQAFIKTWVFAFAWLASSIWWLFISMHRYGGLPAPLAGLAVCLMAAGLAMFYASAASLYHATTKTGIGVLPRASAFAAVWVLAEMLRGKLWTGFPWVLWATHISTVCCNIGHLGWAFMACVLCRLSLPWRYPPKEKTAAQSRAKQCSQALLSLRCSVTHGLLRLVEARMRWRNQQPLSA